MWLFLPSASDTTQTRLHLCCVLCIRICYQAAHSCSTRRDDLLDNVSHVYISLEKLIYAFSSPLPLPHSSVKLAVLCINALCNPSCCCSQVCSGEKGSSEQCELRPGSHSPLLSFPPLLSLPRLNQVTNEVFTESCDSLWSRFSSERLPSSPANLRGLP